MKMTKIFAGFAALAFTASIGFISCSDNTDDDNGSKINNADVIDNESEVDPDEAAFSVLRSLCNLAQYDENAETDEDGIYTGVETLPDGWAGLSFACDEGVVLDDTKPTVRSIAAASTDEAREFFSSMIGKTVTADSYGWDCTKLGALTFTAVKDNDELYATIDVEISAIPNLTQLRFVPADIIEAASSENSYSGKPYYSAGDVIQRNSDGTYWICVRPAGGPLHKDKSYWICLSSFDKSGNTIIKSEVKKNVITYHRSEDSVYDFNQNVKNDWTYAKNLMSLKTAKAAHHTFNCIVNPELYNSINTSYSVPGKIVLANELGSRIYDGLVSNDIDLMNLHAFYKNDDALGVPPEYSSKYGDFCFAYGSPKKDSTRKTSGKNANADVNYIQPFIFGTCDNQKEGEKIKELIKSIWTLSSGLPPYLLSLTDAYDEYFSVVGIKMPYETLSDAYDFKDYLHAIGNSGLAYIDYTKAWCKPSGLHIIISPELCINDNKCKGNETKKPSNAYTDIYRSELPEWWWASLEQTVRYVDGNKVEWNKEND